MSGFRRYLLITVFTGETLRRLVTWAHFAPAPSEK